MKKYKKIIIIILGILVVLALLVFVYFKAAFISKNEVKDIVVRDMNVSSDDIYFETIDFEMDKKRYEVELYYQNRDYEYKVDAKNGRVIYTDFYNSQNIIPDNNNDNNNNNNNNNNTNDDNIDNNTNNNSNGTTNDNQNNTTIPSAKISLEEAKNIALNHANLAANNVQFLRTKTEYEYNTLVYEIDFVYNNLDYEYEISAITGEIISFDKDSIYD